ncbi:dTDP-4-dehydrorhamnose reductase [Seonamhaeicola maritimus]|uniref:dTDP-4-dehydrorhamnose reductase n=1 Tax=Seonamhaeicola maritimus TaxID=2591822 RepID=UPI002495A62C|nr:dTDP-4-dehydrorhamnose reductase [Seonamhaeicola maritimus]
MKNILVTGGKGQLALCIRDLSIELKDSNFFFLDYDQLDITNEEEVKRFFKTNKVDYCVNCAAYTAVDKAESEKVMAKSVNELGAKYLAQACKVSNSVLIQISTDFVFDGEQSFPYKENDNSKPISVYGSTKLDGELAISNTFENYFIIRTSWLYSEYGSNFVKTMLRLGEEKSKINVISDQVGTPTYAKDLASVIMKIINNVNSMTFGTYHYSNEGVASWYDFAKTIFDECNVGVDVFPIETKYYPTPAKRPFYSVLGKEKIKKELTVDVPYWKDSLKKCLIALKD